MTSRVTLSCGSVVEGFPHNTEEYRATAHRMGYGADTSAMCRDHDPLHAALCTWLGLDDSFALRCAAGLRAEDEISAAEEATVLALQRFMRLIHVSVAKLSTAGGVAAVATAAGIVPGATALGAVQPAFF